MFCWSAGEQRTIPNSTLVHSPQSNSSMEVNSHPRSRSLYNLTIIFPKNINNFTKSSFVLQSPTSSRSLLVRMSVSVPPTPTPMADGGNMVVELVGTFNELTERMKNNTHHSLSPLLFKTLKICLPILQSLPLAPDGRSPLSRALSVALLLADLQMDAEVISAGILREVVEGCGLTMFQVKDRIGVSMAHLVHESFRVNNIASKVDSYDDESASALRKFCLTYYDVRALILHLAVKLDMMRHLEYLPRYQQQMVSLEVMKIHAPLAHAVGTNSLSLELEDLSFQYLFPYSYLYLNTWLSSHDAGIIDDLKEQLLRLLKSDSMLAEMVDEIWVEGRYKSHYSTMKKLLRDGRKPEEVNDILGLRVILKPSSKLVSSDECEKACYRARAVIQSLWKEVPSRSKDYISRPKANGYKSLHMAVEVGGDRPLLEIQIRTAEMNLLASDGTASHAFYKGGLTNPEEVNFLIHLMHFDNFLTNGLLLLTCYQLIKQVGNTYHLK